MTADDWTDTDPSTFARPCDELSPRPEAEVVGTCPTFLQPFKG
jgi:hypothetical protein